MPWIKIGIGRAVKRILHFKIQQAHVVEGYQRINAPKRLQIHEPELELLLPTNADSTAKTKKKLKTNPHVSKLSD